MHCSAEARRAAAQAFDSAHIRHVHAFGGKAPSCCHALEARVFGEAGTAKSLSFSSPSPWAQNARYEPSQNAPSVQLSRLGEKEDLTTTLLLLLGLLHDLLDDLLLLDKEGADDTVADAVGAAGATVGTLDGLLGAGDLGVLAGTEGGDLC